MNWSRFSLFIMLVFFMFHHVCAQKHDMIFKHFTSKNGLSFNSVQCILQDSKGYMWLGTTQGLNKFDGSEFNQYIHSDTDSLSISNNIIWAIHEDKTGQIWVGTEDGLNKYNLNSDNFERFNYNEDDSTSLPNSLVKAILETKNGNIWIATWCGALALYNKQKNNFTNIKITYVDTNYVNFRINCLSEDSTGNIWVGTEGGGLYCFNPNTKKINLFRNIAGNIGSLNHNIVRTILTDSKNNVWVGTAGGLNRFVNPQLGFVRYIHDSKNKQSINSGIVDAIFEDGQGRILIGIDGGGLNLLDSTGTFYHYMYNSQNINSIGSNIVRCIYEDKSGNLWVGTFHGGLNLHNKLTTPFQSWFHNDLDPSSLSHNSAMCFLNDSKNKFWVGTDGGGLNLYNSETNSFKSFQHRDNDPTSLSSNAVLSIYEDRIGQLWVGTFNGGLNKFDVATETFTQYNTNFNQDNSLSNPHVWAIYEDTRKNFWVGTMGGGLNLMDRDKGTFKQFLFDENDTTTLSSFLVWTIFEDSKQRLWIGTHNGINLFNYETQKFTSYQNSENDSTSLSNNWVLCVFEDSRNNLWVGTSGGGLNKFDTEKGTFKAYTTHNGLVSNVVLGILEDNYGNLWLSTTHGISKFNTTTNSIQNFDESYGLRSEELNIGAYYKNSEGKMYFGSPEGFTGFNPDDVVLNAEIPRIVLTDLYVLNKKVTIGGKNPRLSKHISEAAEINLAYNDYSFSIAYTALNYFATDKYSYSYKLEGFDKEWNNVGSVRTAVYTNIDPGEYNFKVKASNDSGIWNEEGVSIRVIISPPFWDTWWFKTLLTIVFAAMVYLVYIIKIQGIRRYQNILEKQVTERTFELQETNAQLEEINQEVNQQKEELATQAEILASTNQKLEKSTSDLEKHKNNLEELVHVRTAELENAKAKAEESDRLKSAFLANMSHEIRTPMNAIVGFSSLLNIPDLNHESKNEYISQITANSHSLMMLIDDILDISMMESNQMTMSYTEFELNLLVNELFLDTSLQYPKSEIRLNNDIEDLNLVFDTDRFRLKQILINLLNNACKFTEKGFIEFCCRIANNEMVFIIKDTGIGISDDNLKIIFDRFSKVTDDRTKLFRGVGLGLAISKKITELLGGELKAESKLGVGSTFSIHLPLKIIKQAGVPKHPIEKVIPFNWQNKHILVVEDEETNYLYLESAIKPTKAVIKWVNNGQKALELFEANEKFDIVLMDIKMPMMNGYDATIAIKSIFPNQIIIAQTAYARAEEYVEIKKAGFDDYLIKPLVPNHLYNILAKYF